MAYNGSITENPGLEKSSLVNRLSPVGHFPSWVQGSTAEQKARLVDLGLDALCRGEWEMALAISTLVQRRYRHA